MRRRKTLRKPSVKSPGYGLLKHCVRALKPAGRVSILMAEAEKLQKLAAAPCSKGKQCNTQFLTYWMDIDGIVPCGTIDISGMSFFYAVWDYRILNFLKSYVNDVTIEQIPQQARYFSFNNQEKYPCYYKMSCIEHFMKYQNGV